MRDPTVEVDFRYPRRPITAFTAYDWGVCVEPELGNPMNSLTFLHLLRVLRINPVACVIEPEEERVSDL